MGKYTYKIEIEQECGGCTYIYVNLEQKTSISLKNLKNIVNNHPQYSARYGQIVDFKIIAECEYSYSHNKYIDDELYDDLMWFNNAIKLISSDNPTHIEFNKLFCEYNKYESHQNAKSYFSKSINNIITEIHYYAISDIIEYGQVLLNEFLNMLNINSIIYFDIIKKMFGGEVEITEYNSDFLFQRKFCDSDDDFNRTFYYLENIVLKIKSILNWIYSEIQESGFMHTLNSITLENIFKEFKRELIIKQKILELYNNPIIVDLYDAVSCGDSIIQHISPYKQRDKVKQLLNSIDEQYLITKNSKFLKKRFGAIILILYSSDYFYKNLSFEKFKTSICQYYGQENISIKPNKIIKDALIEYNSNREIFEKYKIKQPANLL